MRRGSVLLATAITAGLLVNAMGGAVANHQPANKVSVASSNLETMETVVVDGLESNTVDLFSTTLKASAPTDLILQVTAECSLVTNLANVGNSDESATATVRVWAEINGDPIVVSSDGPGTDQEKAEVVFCNRAHRAIITDLDDEDARFEQHLSTRTANAFNWVTLNVGSGIHEVVVKAQLVAEATTGAQARAMVGKRSLVIEPTKLANDATI